MKAYILSTLVLNEVRLRARRLSSIVALMIVAALSWAMIVDPQSGMAMVVVDNARVYYNSAAMAMGSATLGSLLFALLGFYLVRGRIAEDLRSGIGGVIAATPISNSLFLLARFLGGAAYLATLILGFMLSVMVCHLIRGEGPIQLLVYLQTYALIFIPMIFFCVSFAILFDSFAPLMGKAGDVIFFFIWVAQLSLPVNFLEGGKGQIGAWLLFDFAAVGASMINFTQHLHTTDIGIGAMPFDAKLAPISMPTALWAAEMVWLRLGSAALALLPLLPAIALFHRYCPDKVKATHAKARRTPLQILNQWLRPVTATVHPLFALSARLPGFAGQVVAEMALALMASPSAIVALLFSVIAGCVANSKGLGACLIPIIAFWGIFISDISTRDFSAVSEELTGTTIGGVAQRYLRHFAATSLLGLLFVAPIALRWSVLDPVRAAALLAGIFSLSALATLFGRCTRTARTFGALFLFALYVMLNATHNAMLDVVAINGAANAESAGKHLGIAVAALLLGYVYNRRQAHC